MKPEITALKLYDRHARREREVQERQPGVAHVDQRPIHYTDSFAQRLIYIDRLIEHEGVF